MNTRSLRASLPVSALAGLLVLGLFTSSCAHSSRKLPATTQSVGGEDEQDWDHWFPHAVLAETESVAEADLTFSPHFPQGLDVEPAIYLSPVYTAVAYVYDSPKYGRVVIVESRPDIRDSAARYDIYKRLEAQSNEPGAVGSIRVDTIRGLPALVSTSEDGKSSSVEIVLDDVQITVMGPILSEDAAIDIATIV